MSFRYITKTEFKAKALEFFREVEMTGQTIIVTDRGKPVIEVKPFKKVSDKSLETLKESVITHPF